MWNAKGGPAGPLDSCGLDCRRGIYCSISTSFTDTEAECNQVAGIDVSQRSKRKDPHSFAGFGGKMQRLFFFNEDQFYEFMADPWLERV
jgi:hypothetical protein